MRYLTADEVLVIHALIVDSSGGSHGVRDAGLVHSAVERPKTAFGGAEQYPDVYTKAAVLLEAIARHHAFVDGNKRTAFVAAARFLGMNGCRMTASNPEVVAFMMRVVEERLDILVIADWLKEHTIPEHGRTKEN